MTRVIFWGFSRAAQVKAYQKFEGQKILYSAFPSKESNVYGLDDFEQEGFTHQLASAHQNTVIPKDLECVFNNNFATYQKQFSRCLRGLGACSDTTRIRKHFWTLLQWYYSKYHTKTIQFAIFAVPPHFGFDKLMSDLLTWMKVPVYYGYQTLFPNKFILYDHNFQSLPPPKPTTSKYPKFPPVNTEELDYMKGISSAPPKARWIRWLRKNVKAYFQSADKRIANKTQIKGEYQFYRNLREAGQWDNDKLIKALSGQPFVYFPLHLQPEMTTSMLGGKYVDQALAIEHLSSILPNNHKIVVKENPKQIYKERSNHFFTRLKKLDNVIFVGKYLNSKWLIQKSAAVSTITGTAGWEAIRFSKPVIVFGHAWYQNFFGVFSFNQQLDIQEVLSSRPNNEQVQQGFDVFLSGCWDGVIDAYYQEHSQTSEEESVTNLTKLLNHLCIINELPKNYE